MTRKQKTKQVVCPNCGGSHELPVGYQITNHKNVSVCLGILTRRAETAEAEAKAAADRIMVLEVAFANSHELNESLGNENRTLTARVAELEATLASDAADENQYLDAYIDAAARDGETIKKLIARVAELEAPRRFKRGHPYEPGMYIIRRADGTVGAARYYTDGYHWGAFSADITHWAEMPEEPTP